MEDIRILINRSSRLIKSISKRILGNDGENLQQTLIFSFEDEFVNGQARLEYQLPDDTTGWLALTEVEETYQIPVRNVLMSEGTIFFQLVVTEGTDETSIPLFKSNIFKMKINESLNTVEIEAPDGYATWLDLANTKLNQMDNFDINVSKVGDTATIEVINRLGETTSASIKDGERGATGPQGIQGVPGYTPVKGVDYYTESEKQEMINYIINDSESEFNQNAAQKTTDFNNNADSKTLGFNQNATNKTNDFNTNATNKTTTFDNNASAKTTTFNENASSKTTDFNSNANTKTTDFDSHVTSKTTDFDTHASGKLTEYNSNHTSKLQEYNDNAQNKIDEYDEHVQELNDEIEYLKDEVNDLSDNQLIAEAEGTEIYVTDSARARLNEFRMTKESSQVNTTGKNLLNNPIITQTKNGITITKNDDGSLILNGTASSATSFYQSITNGLTLLAGEYIHSVNQIKQGLSLSLDNLSATAISNSSGNSKIFTLDSATSYQNYVIYIVENTTFNNYLIKPMIRLASITDDTYEPYTGGEASPSPNYPQEVEVVEGYENLFDKDNANIINCLINGTTKVISNYNDAKTLYIPINGGLTYTIYKRVSQRFVVGSCSSIPSNNVTCSVAIQDNSSNKITITTNENDNYLAVFYYLNGVDTLTEQEILNSIMITKGTSSHPYVPYGNNYVDVKVTGKNLFKSELEIGAINSENGTNASSTNRIRTKDYILINDVTNTLSWLPSNCVMYGYCYDSSKNFLGITTGWNNTPFTFTPITNTSFIRFVWKKPNDSAIAIDDISNIQLEKGSVATSYEPYQESIVPIPLNGNFIGGKDNYLDELIVDKFGKCYLEKRFIKVKLSDLNYSFAQSSTGKNIFTTKDLKEIIFPPINQAIKGLIMATDYTIVAQDDTWPVPCMALLVVSGGYGSKGDVCIVDNRYSNVQDFKSNSTNSLLYYVLKESQLIDLNYTIDLKTFKGVSNITNSEEANMKIRYVQDINTIISNIQNAILEIGGE